MTTDITAFALGQWAYEVQPGTITSADNTTTGVTASTFNKRCDQLWVEGAGTLAVPVGGKGFAGALVGGTWYRVFVIMKPDGTCDSGFDNNATATNLLAAAASAGYTKYRRVGWVQVGGGLNTFIQIATPALNTYQRFDRPNATIVENGQTICGSLPPSVMAKITLRMDTTANRFCLVGVGAGTPSATLYTMASNGSGEITAKLDTTSRVQTLVSNPNAITTLLQRGWYDDLLTP